MQFSSASGIVNGESAVLATTHMIEIDASLPASRRAKAFLRLIMGLQLWARNALLIHVSAGHDLAVTRLTGDRLLKPARMKMLGGGYVG